MSRYDPERDRLTAAAEATVNEITARYRAQLLDEAASRSRGLVITPEDVISANAALKARADSAREVRAEARWLTLDLGQSRANLWLLVGSAYLFMVIGVFGLLTYSDIVDNPAVAIIQAILALIGSLLLLLIMFRLFKDMTRRRYVIRRQTAEVDDEYLRAIHLHPSSDTAARKHLPKQLTESSEPISEVAGLEIVVRWVNLEGLLKRLASRSLGMPEADQMPIGELMRSLHRNGVIDSSMYNALRVALDGRNRAAHGRDISSRERETLMRGLRDLEQQIKALIDAHPGLGLFDDVLEGMDRDANGNVIGFRLSDIREAPNEKG